MKRHIALILALASLAGCEKPEVFSEQTHTMEVVGVYLTSKSNSKVHLKDVKSGQLYQSQYLNCSRDRAKNIKMGSRWDVVEVTYRYPESQRFTSKLVGTAAICAKSN